MFGRKWKKDIEEHDQRVMAMGQNVKDHAGDWSPFAAATQEARLRRLGRDLCEKMERLSVRVQTIGAKASTTHEGVHRLTDDLSTKVSQLTDTVRQLCPHKEVKYLWHQKDGGWVSAGFGCLLCGETFSYEAGDTSHDDMPARFRRILGGMGIDVPGGLSGYTGPSGPCGKKEKE